MIRVNADRNLLLGMLALQLDFVSREALIAAMHAWVLAKARSLGEILLEQGALSGDRNAMLEALVQEHLKQHENDPAKSLAAISAVKCLPNEVEQIQDADVHASLAKISSFVKIDPDETLPTVSVGTPTSSGLRFRVLQEFKPKKGGQGEVYRAHDEELHREVALKQIQEKWADHPDVRANFQQEAEITGGLEHPGIVPVYGLGKFDNGRPYYAMRFLKGGSLRDAIAEFHKADENPDRDQAERTLQFRKLLGRFIDVCYAVEYAHSRGILHRDLKPGNVMLGEYGETLVVDWGLAKVVGRPETSSDSGETTLRPPSARDIAETQPGALKGTPAYMSPEQAAGRVDELGPASDIYSLGATLYELLTSRAPVEDANTAVVLQKVQAGDFQAPRDVKPQTPVALEILCMRAMSLSPSERHASAKKLAEDIERWLAEQPVDSFFREVNQLHQWLAANPTDLKLRESLARSRVNLGIMLHALGRWDSAAGTLRLAVDDYAALIEQEPLSTIHRENVANANLYLSRSLRAAGQESQAREAHLAAFKEYRALAAANPDVPHFEDKRDELFETLAQFKAPDPDKYDPDRDDFGDVVGALPSDDVNEVRYLRLVKDFKTRYTNVEKYWQGGLSTVWLAQDTDLDRRVIIKRLSRESAHIAEREASVLSHLNHPNIVAIYDAGLLPDGSAFLVMPYLKNERLMEKGRLGFPIRGDEDRLVFLRVLQAFVVVCDAISFAHSRGVVHCDLKPQNICADDRDNPIIVDWGLAKLTSYRRGTPEYVASSDATIIGTAMGTPAYMAPEQFEGRLDIIGPGTDVFALGGILFGILTGVPANLAAAEGGNWRDVLRNVALAPTPRARDRNRAIPRALEAICLKALAKNPADRYPSADLLANDVRNWMVGEPVSVYRESFLKRILRATFRSPAVWRTGIRLRSRVPRPECPAQIGRNDVV